MANLVSSPCTTSILCGCPAFAFPAVPHFNNRYFRVKCSTSRTSTATRTAPSTCRLFSRSWRTPSRSPRISLTTHERNSNPGSSPSLLRREPFAPIIRNGAPCPWPAPRLTGRRSTATPPSRLHDRFSTTPVLWIHSPIRQCANNTRTTSKRTAIFVCVRLVARWHPQVHLRDGPQQPA